MNHIQVGIASPNPSYPQEIKVVTGENTIIIENEDGTQSQSYKINFKNLWRNSTLRVAERSTTTGEIQSASVWVINSASQDVKPNTTYTVSQVETPSQYRVFYFQDNAYLSYEQNSQNLTTGYKSFTFTTPNNCNNIYMQFRSTLEIIASTGGYAMNVNAITQVQLEEGSAVTSYMTPIELCKIDTYKDKIYNDDNDKKWYLRKEIGKVVFDGTETWTTSTYGTNSWVLDNLITTNYDTSKTQIMSNIFKGIANDNRASSGDNIIYTYANTGFFIRNTTLTTLAEVHSATNGNYIIYVLATPIEEEITNEALIEQLEAVKLLSGTQNNFTIDADVLPTLNLNYIGEANPHL